MEPPHYLILMNGTEARGPDPDMKEWKFDLPNSQTEEAAFDICIPYYLSMETSSYPTIIPKSS